MHTPQSMHSSGMDDKHVFANIKTIDGTDFDTIRVFALDAIVGHDMGLSGRSLTI